MKKFLSMVMALAMTLTLVTVGASAKDFTDKSAINYGEAVSVINGIGVVNGYTDGSFNPTATLTRGAAAKIICNMLLGPTTASALGVTSAPFSDVPVNNVFAGYIAYCSQAGIINGYGDGTFKPTATVTGYQFMKMLLGALGYDGSIEGFTGSNWTVNVAKLAITLKLNKGNDSFIGSKALTREEACLYAYNTLLANVVTYQSKGTTITTADGTKIVLGASAAGYVDATIKTSGSPNVYYGYKATEADNDAYVQFCETHFSTLKYVTSGVTADNGWAGHEWKLTTAAKAFSDVYANDMGSKLVSYTDTSSLTKGDLYNACTWDTSVNVYVNGTLEYGAGGATGAALDTSTFVSKGSTASAGLDYKGVDFSIYDTNSDGKADTIVVTIAYLAKINTVTAATASTDRTINVTVYDRAGGKSASIETERFAKGDYIMVTPSSNDSTGFNTPVAMTEATMVTATVTAKNATKSTLTADGTTYKFSTYAFLGTADVANYDLSAKYDFFVDAYGYIIGADVNTSATTTLNFAYVNAASVIGQSDTLSGDITAKEAKVKVTYLDGTTAVLNLPVKTATAAITSNVVLASDGTTSASIASGDSYITMKNASGTTIYYKLDTASTATGLQNALKGVCSYTLNSDGTITISKVVTTTGSTVYTAQEVASGKTMTFTDSSAKVTIDTTTVTNLYATTSTKMVVIKDGSSATYTGYANFPAATYTDGTSVQVVYVANDSNVLTNVLVIGGTIETSTAVDAYGYYIGEGNETSDGQYYDFYVDGAVKSYLVADSFDASTLSADHVYGLTFNSDGAVVTAATDKSVLSATVTYVGDGFIVAGGNVIYTDTSYGVYDVTTDDTIVASTIAEDDVISYAYTTTDSTMNHMAVAFIVG